MFMLFLLLALNFGISWFNAKGAGKVWSESKELGGMMRFHAVIGYAMAIAGFTMVYGVLLTMILPYILPLLMEIDQEDMWSIQQLANDMLYILIGTFIVPAGFYIWFKNVVSFWRRRNLREGMRLGWNTYAQIRNTVNFARNAPDVLGRISKALFGKSGKDSKGKTVLVKAAVFVVLLAILGGWLTASAIMHKEDKKYDLFEGIIDNHNEKPSLR
jgi:hypothetical protein